MWDVEGPAGDFSTWNTSSHSLVSPQTLIKYLIPTETLASISFSFHPPLSLSGSSTASQWCPGKTRTLNSLKNHTFWSAWYVQAISYLSVRNKLAGIINLTLWLFTLPHSQGSLTEGIQACCWSRWSDKICECCWQECGEHGLKECLATFHYCTTGQQTCLKNHPCVVPNLYGFHGTQRRCSEKLVLVVFIHTMETKGHHNCFITNILQNIFFCVPQRKESHTGLEWYGGLCL